MFNLIEKDGQEFLSVYMPGHEPKAATDAHPNFDKIVEALRANPTDPSVLELFDIPKVVQARFETLSERVSVRDGKMYLDGVEVHNVLADQVVRFLYDGVDDWQGLVRFYENLLANPLEHSREQLYEWLSQHEFTITEDGCLLGYKAVYSKIDPETGEQVGYSSRAGYAIVDGEEIEHGTIPYRIGSVVTMPRDKVQHDPAVGCSFGLHVGTYNYASTFLGSSGHVVTVKVNPRDVVSVPTECSWAKLRCCRLEVLEINEGEYQTPLAYYGAEPEADELPRLIPASEYQRLKIIVDGEDNLSAHDLRDDHPDDTVEPEYCDGCGEEDSDCYCSDDDDICGECGLDYYDCYCGTDEDW